MYIYLRKISIIVLLALCLPSYARDLDNDYKIILDIFLSSGRLGDNAAFTSEEGLKQCASTDKDVADALERIADDGYDVIGSFGTHAEDNSSVIAMRHTNGKELGFLAVYNTGVQAIEKVADRFGVGYFDRMRYFGPSDHIFTEDYSCGFNKFDNHHYGEIGAIYCIYSSSGLSGKRDLDAKVGNMVSAIENSSIPGLSYIKFMYKCSEGSFAKYRF